MKKAELKNMLKPLVKECIKECLFEEGVLSSVVSEVVKGMGTTVIKEEVAPPVFAKPVRQQPSSNGALKEHKQKHTGRRNWLALLVTLIQMTPVLIYRALLHWAEKIGKLLWAKD